MCDDSLLQLNANTERTKGTLNECHD